MSGQTIRVYIYRHRYEPIGSTGYTLAYTRMQTNHGYCVHDVEAMNGYEAKKIAKREHKDICENRFTS